MNGLLQIGNATSAQGLPACRCVVESGHEDDRKGRPGCFEAPPQANSGKPAKMDVQKKAIDRLSDIALKKCLGGVEDQGCKAVRVQQKPDGVECARIIVDDCDHLSPY